jgi:uncharacterized protein YndB with AHSA1/START domain
LPQITSGRFIIFTKLGHRGLPEHRAQEHTEPFDVSAPAITKHLRVLESAGLIERRKEGRVNYCCLSEDGLEDASDWTAWTKPEALRQWWCPEGWIPAEIDVDLCAGGAFRIGMRRLSGGTPVYVHGHFGDVQPPERLTYPGQWENAFDGMPQTHVTVQFTDLGAATELLLTHENLPEIPVCLEHRSGWLAAWTRLEHTLTR